MDLLAHLKTMVETRKISGAGVLTLDTYNERIQASHARLISAFTNCRMQASNCARLILHQWRSVKSKVSFPILVTERWARS